MIIRLKPSDPPYQGWDIQIDDVACHGYLFLLISKGYLWRYWKMPSDIGNDDAGLEPKPAEPTASRKSTLIYDLSPRGHWQVRCAFPRRPNVLVTFLKGSEEVTLGSTLGFMVHIPVRFRPQVWGDEKETSFWKRLGGVQIEYDAE